MLDSGPRLAIVTTPNRNPSYHFKRKITKVLKENNYFDNVEFCWNKNIGRTASRILMSIKINVETTLHNDDDKSDVDVETTDLYEDFVNKVRIFSFKNITNTSGVVSVLRYVLANKFNLIDESLSYFDEMNRDIMECCQVNVFARSIRCIQNSTAVTDIAWLCGLDIERTMLVFSVYNIHSFTQLTNIFNDNEIADVNDIFVGWWNDPNAPIIYINRPFKTKTSCCARLMRIIFWTVIQIILCFILYNWLFSIHLFIYTSRMIWILLLGTVQFSFRSLKMMTTFGTKGMIWRIPSSYMVVFGIIIALVRDIFMGKRPHR